MKTIVKTDNAPAAIGPYSQGVGGAGLIFVSGQLPLNPETGKFPPTIEEMTRQSLSNIRAILEAAGSSMEKVVKTTVFLRDMNDFSAMNSVYAEFFPETACPARSAVEVVKLPKDARIEIEAIALA